MSKELMSLAQNPTKWWDFRRQCMNECMVHVRRWEIDPVFSDKVGKC